MAFIAVTGPDVRLTTASLPGVAPIVLDAAAELGAALDEPMNTNRKEADDADRL